MHLFQFVIVRFLIFFALGILFGSYFVFPWEPIFVVLLFFILCLIFLKHASFIKINQKIYAALFIYILMFLLGVLSITFHTHTNQSNHYTNTVNNIINQRLKLHVFKKLKSTNGNQKYLVKILSVNENKTNGLLMINIDSTRRYFIDDLIYINTVLYPIKPSSNPHQFDYKAYMSYKNIFHQVYLNKNNSFCIGTLRSAYGLANSIRNKIYLTFVRRGFSNENLSILNALFLGQRQDVSRETYNKFSKSGALHILAISGLHIGLLTLVLSFIFKPICNYNLGRKIIPFFIIFVLWFYAFVTGMSVSVVRAVTMFSLFTISHYFYREANSYNVLAISAIILLLYNPFYLFDVGFQLSYFAVFSIISIKPLLDRLWVPNNFIIRRIWDIFTVTLAVQFGVLPLSLFYFHQFPSLLFVSNLVIIPFLGVLFCIGLLSIILAFFDVVPDLLIFIFKSGISFLMEFINFIADKNSFVFSNISFGKVHLVCWYVLIISLFFLFSSFSYKRLNHFLFSIIILQFGYLYNKFSNQHSSFIIFNQYNNTLIAQKNGNALIYFNNDLLQPNVIKTFIQNEGITDVTKEPSKNIYRYKGKTILIIDERCIYNTSFYADIVVMVNSPKINLDRLLSYSCPKLIVADNSNYKSFVKKWKATCLSNNILFYDIKEKGAFIIK